MVKRRSIKAQEHNIEIEKAVLAVRSNQFKSAYAAAKALDLPVQSIRRRLNVATRLAIESYVRLQMKSGQISVAFFSLNTYSFNNHNYNYNYNLKYLSYLLGKIGFHDSFKGILTYVLS
ncbi:hypothetical protein VE01_10722 [Pseudogymnoascus verrucosus]|uniref:Uncharacterized protein n=1 Tax=Pseudogymnoascus verrucosus TaxID=342668 RepID=A0A1B8G645_9PEZI|nr:uncharacterized protein VE01_10722 [Pseudogymnoascus verrucosus]OBT91305.1 hypothetical protein VE01_10722 [Pseudogymnoascus verrucosus]